MGFAAYAALAVGPGLVLVHVVWSRDRRREPLGNLTTYLLLGALAVAPAAALEGLLGGPIAALLNGAPLARTLVGTVLGVALVEELCKLAVLRLRARSDRHLDEPFDWLVYAVAVALGFATLENVVYVANGGVGVAVLRAFTAVPGHALDGTLMGWRLARAHARSGAAAARERRLAWIEPTLWHAAYDVPLLAAGTVEEGTASLLLLAWPLVVLTQWVVCVRRLRRMCAEQRVPAPPVLLPALLRGRRAP